MTNDLEIDRALALAIGWREEQMRHVAGELYVLRGEFGHHRWSHLDPAVIWPIAERFNRFPQYNDISKQWIVWTKAALITQQAAQLNPATAVAMAVIAATTEKAHDV